MYDKDPWKSATLPIFSVDLSRDKNGFDSFIENGVVEHETDSFSGKGIGYVIQRPTLTVTDSLTNKTGLYHHSYYPYYCLGTTVFKQVDGGGASTIITGTNATTTKSKFTNIRDTQNKRDQLIFVEGNTGKLWSINKATSIATEQTTAPIPANPHVAELDGYLIVALDGSDEIYNSNLNDVSTWNLGVNFIRSSASPGNITGLTAYKNYIIAFKAETAEFFYNAGLTGTSPLQRNDSLRMSVGCAYPFTIAKGEDSLVWVGQGISGKTPSVYVLVGESAQKISTPAIERQLQSLFVSYDKAADFRGWLFKDEGHTFYVLKTTTTTFAYNFESKQWSYWSYNFGADIHVFDIFDPPEETTLGPYFYWADGSNTYLGKLSNDNIQYDSILGTNYPIVVRVESPLVDLGTVKRKQISLLRLMGSIHATYNSRIRWSDDDGANWSSWRTLPIDTNPVLRNLGQTRRRKFQFEFANVSLNDPSTRLNTLPTKLRFEGFEVEYREGIS